MTYHTIEISKQGMRDAVFCPEECGMKVLRITPERCTGCMRCEIACSYMQTETFQPAKSVIRVSAFEAHTSYAPYTCTQCAEAWCMVACPVEAISISAVGAKVVTGRHLRRL
jgi:anaerobic carbon-monoxide dehydrogenase iron sulfur subunit